MADEGNLDMATAVFVVGGFIALGAVMVVVYGPAGAWGLLALMILAGNILPQLGTLYTRKLNQQYDDVKIQKYRAALERDSRNCGAHALLAEEYAAKARFAEAIAHYEAALQLSPDPERNPHLEKWTRRLKQAREAQHQQSAKKTRRARN